MRIQGIDVTTPGKGFLVNPRLGGLRSTGIAGPTDRVMMVHECWLWWTLRGLSGIVIHGETEIFGGARSIRRLFQSSSCLHCEYASLKEIKLSDGKVDAAGMVKSSTGLKSANTLS